jgi:hypothetical protein
VFLFKGLGRGAFAERAALSFRDGTPALAGLASAVCVVDWDRDGKLDLVVGDINGAVSFLRNASSDGKLAFEAPRNLIGTGQLSRVSGDAGPLVVDWDGDGVLDLLVGCDDGSVTFFKGQNADGPPRLAAGVKIVPSLDYEQLRGRRPLDPKTGEIVLPTFERSLLRSKPAVYDWNGDGKLDLLVGDFVSFLGDEPQLDAEATRTKDDFERRARAVDGEIEELSHAATMQASAELGVGDSWSYPNSAARHRVSERRDSILRANPRHEELQSQSRDLASKLAPFRPKYAAHGFVWVYLRK